MNNVLLAFSLTLFAGLSTGIGSAIAFFAKRTNTKFLALSLGFSAGVMLYVSFVEIFAQAKIVLISELGVRQGTWFTVIAFFSGIFLIAIIDKFVPSGDNPHELHSLEDLNNNSAEARNKKLMRTGLFTALAITIHNFPEGLATFTAALQNPSLGISVAVAIAIHNIPEGIAVSVPIFYATGDRRKAFKYSFLSGLSEPLGAIVGYVLLRSFMSDFVFGYVFAMVGGIMVFISLDELLPSAQKFGEHHLSIYGLIAGMIVMAISLMMFV